MDYIEGRLSTLLKCSAHLSKIASLSVRSVSICNASTECYTVIFPLFESIEFYMYIPLDSELNVISHQQLSFVYICVGIYKLLNVQQAIT